jgi:CBS domain-containing protein
VYDAIWHMRSKGIRRLPVVDSHNGLKGILTADDVARYLAQQLSDVASIVPQQLLREHKLVAPTDAPPRKAQGAGPFD